MTDTKVWLTFEVSEKFFINITTKVKVPSIDSGDYLLVGDYNEKSLVGFRRIYLVRYSKEFITLYFDKIIDFKEPVSLSDVGFYNEITLNTVVRIETSILERLLDLSILPPFDKLPDLHDNASTQNYIRDLLEISVTDDLLGPAQGPEEDIIGMSVRDRYLVGKLSPKIPYDEQNLASPFTKTEDSDKEEPSDLEIIADKKHKSVLSSPEDDDENDDDEVVDSNNSQTLTPSSIGFTFCIDETLPVFELLASWGRYEKDDPIVDERNRKIQHWKRIPSGGQIPLKLKEGIIQPIIIDNNCPQVIIKGSVSKKLPNGSRMVTLFLVNDQVLPATNQDESWIFQPELRVKSIDNKPIFMRRPILQNEKVDDEMESLNMMYRKQVEFAVGHGVSVGFKQLSNNDYEHTSEIYTVVIPKYEVPITETPGIDTNDRPAMKRLFSEGMLDMKKIASIDKAQLIDSLNVLAIDYSEWINEQKKLSSTQELTNYTVSANETIKSCEKILKRLLEGIKVLDTDSKALEAFRFANEVMAEQRIHSLFALSQRRKENKDLASFYEAKNHSWRPFQLAFIFLSIPSLANPEHDDRTETINANADLLWFPTGGGKTEAYLGVAAFAMAIRRLQGKLGDLDNERGLTVIMRYTLRLLTIQQFQRATALICAMETKRITDPDKWGNTPFSIGLWVGKKTTPNTTKDSADVIEKERNGQFGTGSTPAQLTTCPWCGSEIKAGREIIVDKDIGRTKIFCGDPKGKCEFSHAKSKIGLPVVVVDDEIYHRPPTMLIATVDKFAMMAWKGAIRTLFGRAEEECPRHGLIWPDKDSCCNGNHTKTNNLNKTSALNISNIRPPDLIIQDEFHLISGPLGTMVGLYETAVDDLASWSYNNKTIRPKVIASTATVRRADEQINNVFLRKVNIFPPHGIDVSDNFFSVQRSIENKPGRRYLGICSPGASRPAVLIRVYVALLTAAQSLFEKFGQLADPYMTLVGYFNSLKELGGMRRLAEDDVQTRCFRVVLDGNIVRPGLAQRRVYNVDELTSRVSSKDIPSKLDLLEKKFKKSFAKNEDRPMDIVLATNMLSVGVDVNRLGLMVVNGQPKNTAEYIQATSRVGRSFPGLVCTVFAWSRPRDLSHYETFEHYHSTFYKHVEAQSVTPFAPRALDRGLFGMMVSLLRLKELKFNPNEGAANMSKASFGETEAMKKYIADRAWNIENKKEVKDRTERMVNERIDCWMKENMKQGTKLSYEEIKKQGNSIALLKKPGIGVWDMQTVPTSMREVEAGVRLVMDKSKNSSESEPEWTMFVDKSNNNQEEENVI